jgi:iron complex outermembrane receptor protein
VFITLVLTAAAPLAVQAESAAQPAVQAPGAAASQRYQIPAGPLGQALTAFAADAGISISAPPALLQGKHTAGLSGSYGVEQALARLLAGSALQAHVAGPGSYVLRLLPVVTPGAVAGQGATLGEVKVTAQAEQESAWGPAYGYVARRSASGSKTDTLLVETPQSISVVTREKMDDQGVQHLGESMRYLANVRPDSGGAQNAASNVYIRGFQSADFYVDGLRYRPLGFFGMMAEEPYGVERVEVFKGPTSGLYGQSNPGGIVNLVSKRPTDYERGQIELSPGTDRRMQLAADVSGPLDADKTLLYRMVALGRKADAVIDHQKDDRVYLAPSISWRPNGRTSLDVRAVYQKNWALASTSVPWAAVNGSSPHGRVPMDRFLGEPGFDKETQEQKSLAYELRHALNEQWTVAQNFRYGDFNNHEDYLARASGLVNGTQLLRNYQLRHAYGDVIALDNQLLGRVKTGAAEHQLLFGLDYSRSNTVRDEKWGTGPVLDNVFAPKYGAAVDTSAFTSWVNASTRTTQLGVYLQDQIKLGHWMLTLGTRHDKVSTEVQDRWSGSFTTDRSWSATTGRAGLNYVFDSGLAPYVGYSESFSPVSDVSSPARGSKAFEPETGKQVEVGIKYQPPGQDSLVTLAVFDLRRQNVSTLDPDDERYSVQTGETRSRGIELEGILQLTRQLRVAAAYSYNDIVVTKDNVSSSGYTVKGKGLFKAPAHMASLWVDHRFDEGVLKGLGVGLGARYMGSAWGDALNTFKVPSYTLLDLALRYDLAQADPRWKGWTASLNVRNLSNRYYVASCFFALACNMGEGRTAVAKLAYQW